MEHQTTTATTFIGRKGLPADKVERRIEDAPKPIIAMSSYMASFPNWNNGKKDIFIEKSP